MRFAVQKVLGLLAVLALLAPAKPALAAVIVNGDFSNGLNGWSVTTGPGNTDTVTIAGGTATIDNTGETVVSVSSGIATISQSALDPSVSEIDLYQVFTVPSSPESLQFTLSGLTPGMSDPPAGFGSSLLDPLTGLPLVPTVDATTDSFFTHDLTAGAPGLVAMGVTATPSLTSDPPLTISVDVSGLTVGSSAEILFRVLEGGDLNANASFTNVVFNEGGGAPHVVPEPGTFGMLLAGMTGLIWLKRRLRFDRSCRNDGSSSRTRLSVPTPAL